MIRVNNYVICNHYFHEFKKLLLCESLNIGGQFEANVLANKINRTMNLIEI